VHLRSEEAILAHAYSGTDGYNQVCADCPDLILLDFDMPDMNGFEVCKKLKARPESAHVPIIFLTATDNSMSKVEGLDLGAVDYITKPFDPYELRARVRAALRMQKLFHQRSQIDELTGLWTRAHFDQRLQEFSNKAKRYGRPYGLVMLDVDHFKSVNDEYGHPLGDHVLSTVGKVIKEYVRTSDVPCRYGGEEFAILLPETSVVDALGLVRRIYSEFQKLEFKVEGGTLLVRASFGVSGVDPQVGELVGNEENIGALILSEADKALYRAKKSGRNRVCLSDRVINLMSDGLF